MDKPRDADPVAVLQEKIRLLDKCFEVASEILGRTQGVVMALEGALKPMNVSIPVYDEGGKRVSQMHLKAPEQDREEIALEIVQEAIGLAEELWLPFQSIRHELAGIHEDVEAGEFSGSSAHEVIWLISDRIWRCRKPKILLPGYVPGLFCHFVLTLDIDRLGRSLDIEHSRAVRQLKTELSSLVISGAATKVTAAAIGDAVPNPGSPDQPVLKEIRVSVTDALAGRPDLGLEPTPKATLYRWMGQKARATSLGIDPKGMKVIQLLSVEALKKMRRAGRRQSGSVPRGSTDGNSRDQ